MRLPQIAVAAAGLGLLLTAPSAPAASAPPLDRQVAALAAKLDRLERKVAIQQRQLRALRRTGAGAVARASAQPKDVVARNLIVEGKAVIGGTAVGNARLQVNGGPIAGDGSGLTNLNAANLATGTLPGARLAGTYANAVAFTNAQNAFAGNGNALTGFAAIARSGSASDLIAGTVPEARLTGFAPIARSGSASDLTAGTLPDARLAGTYSNAVTFASDQNAFTGNGDGLTGFAPIARSGSASHLTTGTLPSGRLSGTYSNAVSFVNDQNSLAGDGSGVTGVNAKYLNGRVIEGGVFTADSEGKLSVSLPQSVFTTSFITLYDKDMKPLATAQDAGGFNVSGLTPGEKYIGLAVGR